MASKNGSILTKFNTSLKHRSSRATVQALPWAFSALNVEALSAGRLFELYGSRLLLRRPPKWILRGLVLALAVALLVYELRTSALQSRFFSYIARQMTYQVQPGASPNIVFPESGPFDARHGYSRIPQFQRRLEDRGFKVKEQSRFSTWMAKVTKWGVTPPYREPASAGLVIRSADHEALFDSSPNEHLFTSFEAIPGSVVQALLFMENRELGDDKVDPSSNPVMEWDRLAKAGFSYAGSKLGLPFRLEGGSTLATQLEKYRHSPGGRTASAGDKLRQMVGASLKVYRSGTDTRQARREIILDYLNSMPLAAVPGYGEVNGLGEGLLAWFGVQLDDVCAALQEPAPSQAKARAFKQVLTLLSAVRAPGYYLLQDRAALEARVLYYARSMAESGLIQKELAHQLEQVSEAFASRTAAPPVALSPQQKSANALRVELMQLLGVSGFYDLDRIDLDATSTFDARLQRRTTELFASLQDEDFLDRHGLRQERLLSQGDPRKVIYSLMLYERTPQGNLLRVQTDNLADPLDLNEGMKMELGSTAKVRTLAHYLELVALLYEDRAVREAVAGLPGDPITQWVAETLKGNPKLSLEQLLELALDRTYSASPGEAFFTGGGLHTFNNFDSKDNGRRLTVREATRRSTNLVFIRLMRDLVRFHQARLGYNAEAILNNLDDPVRHRLLKEIADDEARQTLFGAYQKFRGLPQNELVARLLGKRAQNPRHLAILFYAWHSHRPADVESQLSAWLSAHGADVSAEQVKRLVKAYGSPRLTLADYGYLLGRHPLDVWIGGELLRDPGASWTELWGRAGEAKRVSSAWLFQTRNRRAQDLRLRIRIEQDAFARMTPYWQRLGFPFERLVPSYATAIGNSSDRPAALAELMGVILNEGVLRPSVRLQQLRFASNTPYHTVIERSPEAGTRVLAVPVARALKQVLAEVVTEGTARRLAGAFVLPDGSPIVAGGKTGSGDNRFKSFSRGGGVIASRAVNRTATFAFYVGDRYFGVISASVLGREAEAYRFTSSLPVAILRLLAPALNERFAGSELLLTSTPPALSWAIRS